MQYNNMGFGSINAPIYMQNNDNKNGNKNEEKNNKAYLKKKDEDYKYGLKEKTNNKKLELKSNNAYNFLSDKKPEYDKDFKGLNKEIDSFKSKLEENDKKKKKLELDYETQISDLNKKLLDKEQEIEQSKKTILEKENKINELNERICSNTKEIENLKLAISSNSETLEKLKNNDLIKMIEISYPNCAIEDLVSKYDEQDPLNFYDIIVDINSIKEFVNGWDILKNKIGDENLRKTDENSIKIGVLGNSNKGKSFILSKISDIEFPVGKKTKGLSIKFPNLENHINRNITLLDCAGQETPLLNNYKNNVNNPNPNLDNKTINENPKNGMLIEKSRDKLLINITSIIK